MIATDEPAVEALKIIPWRGFFWWQGTKVDFAASRTIGRARLPDVYHRALEGDFGRYWIADPCTMRNIEIGEFRLTRPGSAQRRLPPRGRYRLGKGLRETRGPFPFYILCKPGANYFDRPGWNYSRREHSFDDLKPPHG